MGNISYKDKAIKRIREICKEYEIEIPKMYLQKISIGTILIIEFPKKFELNSENKWDYYTRGKIIGQIRALAELFNLIDKDFEVKKY